MKTVPLYEQFVASDKIMCQILDNLDQHDDNMMTPCGTVALLKKRAAMVVPIVDDLDMKVYEATKDGNLEMTSWGTTSKSCRGAWAIRLAGEDGIKLMREFGPLIAARIIYEASTGRMAPSFSDTNEEALKDIKRCAGVI